MLTMQHLEHDEFQNIGKNQTKEILDYPVTGGASQKMYYLYAPIAKVGDDTFWAYVALFKNTLIEAMNMMPPNARFLVKYKDNAVWIKCQTGR